MLRWTRHARRVRGEKLCLTPAFGGDQEAFIRQAIETRRLHHEEDAVEEARLLWEERE
jgi:hypothetical protein